MNLLHGRPFVVEEGLRFSCGNAVFMLQHYFNRSKIQKFEVHVLFHIDEKHLSILH